MFFHEYFKSWVDAYKAGTVAERNYLPWFGRY